MNECMFSPLPLTFSTIKWEVAEMSLRSPSAAPQSRPPSGPPPPSWLPAIFLAPGTAAGQTPAFAPAVGLPAEDGPSQEPVPWCPLVTDVDCSDSGTKAEGGSQSRFLQLSRGDQRFLQWDGARVTSQAHSSSSSFLDELRQAVWPRLP